MQRLILLMSISMSLTGCANIKPQDYQGSTPSFVLEEYFSGHTKAWGIFQKRNGQVSRQFQVDIVGEWDGENLVLTEDFRFRDGEQSQRVWHIRKIDPHRYEGRADDVDGIAQGTQYGQALQWEYTLVIDVEGKTYKVKMDDWMYLQDDGVLINRTRISKFGFRVGEITIVFRKDDDQKQPGRDKT